MRKGRRLTAASMSFNATPLVDVIFTLTIFFMLVARFSSAEYVSMELPDPRDSQARAVQPPQRVVINCVLVRGAGGNGSGVQYSLGPNPPESLPAIAERLRLLQQQTPALQAVIRADRRLPFADVRAVMRTLADARIEVLNVAARVDDEE